VVCGQRKRYPSAFPQGRGRSIQVVWSWRWRYYIRGVEGHASDGVVLPTSRQCVAV